MTALREGPVPCMDCGRTVAIQEDCYGSPGAWSCTVCFHRREQWVTEGMKIYHQVRERLALRDRIIAALRAAGHPEAAEVVRAVFAHEGYRGDRQAEQEGGR